MTYQEQLQIEKLNRETEQLIYKTVTADNFINFYINHTRKETIEQFKLRNEKQLTRILRHFNYDFSIKKPSKFKGKPAARSHESYIAGGQKSAETQKANWESKTNEEKEAWSIKMSECHLNSPTFAEKITESNRRYRYSLTEEEKARQDEMRKNSMKLYWESLSDEEREALKQSCNGKTYSCSNSGPNLAFEKLLKDNNIDYEREYSLDKKRFDFKVGNVLIEINPTFTHNSTYTPFEYNKPLDKNYHKNKTLIANKYNFRCIHIFDWEDQNKILKLLSRQKTNIAARDCMIKLVEKQEAIDFLFENHLQNYAKDSIRYGLYYNNELVAIMTFKKPRYNKNYEYELVRYCTKYNVLGGAEKLFKHFINDIKPGSIISYCDLSKFSGSTYIKLNFTLLKNNTPSKHWYNLKTKEHYTDSLLRQQGFSRLIHGCDAKDDNLDSSDNKTLMINAGFVEVYDCGQATYIWQATN